jgi:hypothetical protein
MDLPLHRCAATGAANRLHRLSVTAQPDAGRLLHLILELGAQKRCVTLHRPQLATSTVLAGSKSRGLT